MKNIATLLAAMLLAGCATIGNSKIADKDAVSKIVAGKSTKADVQALVGEPGHVFFADDKEIWTYTYLHSQARAASFIPVVGLFAGGADSQTNSLTVVFTKDGIVKNAGFGHSTGSVRD
jgi:outer membrane protein assembly factor BamE (lipoprotein component of BamABCDE complex)